MKNMRSRNNRNKNNKQHNHHKRKNFDRVSRSQVQEIYTGTVVKKNFAEQ
jgi:hypothetical protein